MLPIESELQLRVAIENIDRMYRLAESEASETLWDEETRREMSGQTTHLRETLEREVALYLAQKYQLNAAQPQRKKTARPSRIKSPTNGKITANV